MKYQILFLSLIVSFFTVCCSTDGISNEGPSEVQVPQYHLIHVSGGIAGVDHNFDLETIIWVFSVDAINGEGRLSVQNNNNDGQLEDALDAGSYSYSIFDDGANEYLHIDGQEFGHLDSSTTDILIVDQTKSTTGPVSDGFIYTFELKTITVDLGGS